MPLRVGSAGSALAGPAPGAPAPRRCRQGHTTAPAAAPRTAHTTMTSKPRAKADPENLGLVEGFLFEGEREIETDRPDRRLPRHAHAGGRPNRRAVLDRRLDAAGQS